MNFLYYGELEWLDPKEFYADCWSIVESVRGTDKEPYDIVINLETQEYRYTNI